MQLPWYLTQDPALSKMQTVWRSILNPFLAKVFLQGQLLTGVELISGATVINHKLDRMQQGWVITDLDAAAAIYRSAAFNDTTLTLTSNAAVTVNLWVF